MSIETYADVTTKLSDVIAATEDPTVRQDHSTLASRVGQTGLLVVEYNTAVDGDAVAGEVIGTFPANAIISGPVIVQATAANSGTIGVSIGGVSLGDAPTVHGAVVATSVADGAAVNAEPRDITLAAGTSDTAVVVFIPHIIGGTEIPIP